MAAEFFQQGEFLFKEGDPIDRVLKIRRGSVEIMRERRAAAIVLGSVQSGQFLGEMGVLEGRPVHSATAQAVSDVEAEAFTSAEFLDAVSRTSEAARELILRLSQRLHEADDRIVADEEAGGPRPQPDRDLGERGPVEGLRLAPATAALRRQVKADLPIGAPFVFSIRVGRSSEGQTAPRADAVAS